MSAKQFWTIIETDTHATHIMSDMWEFYGTKFEALTRAKKYQDNEAIETILYDCPMWEVRQRNPKPIFNKNAVEQKRDGANWIHDCPRCELVRANKESQTDLWVCRRSYGASWILRYSDDGPDYSSFPEDIIYALSKSPSGGHPIVAEMVAAGIEIESLPRSKA